MDIERAIEVLGLAQHRGCRAWSYDARLGRVLPSVWNGMSGEPAASFTTWEAVTLARGLVQIGAIRPGGAADPHTWG